MTENKETINILIPILIVVLILLSVFAGVFILSSGNTQAPKDTSAATNTIGNNEVSSLSNDNNDATTNGYDTGSADDESNGNIDELTQPVLTDVSSDSESNSDEDSITITELPKTGITDSGSFKLITAFVLMVWGFGVAFYVKKLKQNLS